MTKPFPARGRLILPFGEIRRQNACIFNQRGHKQRFGQGCPVPVVAGVDMRAARHLSAVPGVARLAFGNCRPA
ncbi:MAG: hypothetical protein LJE68_19130 [Rhodobacter sp.]|nr:hypothetical protein [Rhodobacter sp.]